MVSKLFIIALIVGTTSAATWMGFLPPKPKEFEDKEGCYIKEIENVVPFGTTVRPIGHCYRVHCSEKTLRYASCGSVATYDPKCYVTEQDVSKPYPDCCPKIKCDLDNKLI